MKCIVEFSDGRSIIVEAQNQTEAIALARVELIKQGDKECEQDILDAYAEVVEG